MDKNNFSKKTVAELLGKTTEQISAVINKEEYSFLEIMDLAFSFEDKGSYAFLNWVSNRMSEYMNNGFVIEEETWKKLRSSELSDLESVLKIIQKNIATPVFEGKESELIALIDDYAQTWNIFHEYDEGGIQVQVSTRKAPYEFWYQEAKRIVSEFISEMEKRGISNDLFAREVDNKLEIIVESLNQTFDGVELYKGVEDRAAHLLYLIVKDHPFVDGNKRVGSMLFLYFLEKNRYAWKVSNERKINDNALVALTLLIAESKPESKGTMINLVKRLLQNDRIDSELL
jgi:death-on-curing family protein